MVAVVFGPTQEVRGMGKRESKYVHLHSGAPSQPLAVCGADPAYDMVVLDEDAPLEEVTCPACLEVLADATDAHPRRTQEGT